MSDIDMTAFMDRAEKMTAGRLGYNLHDLPENEKKERHTAWFDTFIVVCQEIHNQEKSK